MLGNDGCLEMMDPVTLSYSKSAQSQVYELKNNDNDDHNNNMANSLNID